MIFFRASKWGDRASSRGLVLRLGLRHRRSDPIVITDGSSSLCVHGPPGSIRWAELVCGRFSAAPTNSRRGGDTAPSYDSSVRRRTLRVHRNRRGTRTVVEGRASIVTSPGGTAAPGSWIHHVGVLNADRVLVRRRRASEETRRRRGCGAAAPRERPAWKSTSASGAAILH